MTLKKILKDLKESSKFKEWNIKNPSAYLCSCFSADSDWQFCFYSSKKDKMTTFTNNRISQSDSEIFRKEKTKINELKIEDIKIDLPQALKIFEGRKEEKYLKEKPSKKIVILQNLDSPMWNITYLISLQILNMKIDAITGAIISETINSVMNYRTK